MARRKSMCGTRRPKVSIAIISIFYLSLHIITFFFLNNAVFFFSMKISYRLIVLRALPNLEMLDNVSVTPEELSDAMKGGHAVQNQEEVYEDAYSNGGGQQQAQQQQQQQSQQQQQQYRQQSPVREVSGIALWSFSYFPIVV